MTRDYGDSALSSRFGPRFAGRGLRPSSASTRSRNALDPSGLPVLSDRRSAPDSGASSPARSSAAKSGTRVNTGAVSVMPSPRAGSSSACTLDQRQSCARAANRAHRIECDVAQRRERVRIVHRYAAEPALPEVSSAPLARVNPPGIGAVHLGQCGAQRVAVLGHQDQVDMVGHQHPAPHRDAMRGAVRSEQVAIGGVVGGREERPLPGVAALGDVVRDAGDHVARKSGHCESLAESGAVGLGYWLGIGASSWGAG